MQIKKFEAPTMTEALRLIKMEFGPDAVILSARSMNKEKSVLGIKRASHIEVTAATDTRNVQPVSAFFPKKSINPVKGQNISVRIDDPISKKPVMGTIQSSSKSIPVPKVPPPPPVPSGKGDNAMQLFQNHFRLQGVEEFFIMELSDVLSQGPAAGLKWGSSAFNARLLDVFSEMGISAGTAENDNARPRLHGFVGPAGVGKTSAIARLTAICTHQLKQNVGWITFDTNRVAAASLLQVYGKIFGVPVELVSGIKDFREALKRFDSMDHIFIDTPGMGIRDSLVIGDLSEIFLQASVRSVYLVVSASTKSEDLIQITKAYKPLSVSSLIITKLDESRVYGNVFNLLIRSKLPVSYFTNGQMIPHGIETATMDKVLGMMLNPGKENDLPQAPAVKTAEIIPYANNHVQTAKSRNYYVAIRESVYFHRPDCGWVKQTKPKDRIKLESIEEAVEKEYIPCKTCCSNFIESRNMKETRTRQVGNNQSYYLR